MSKKTAREKRIIALALFHRYGWVAFMTICVAIWPEQVVYILSFGCIAFSGWTFVGYRMKWKHIYCSFQSASHEKMTPNNIQWHKMNKSDVYGIPLIFLIAGIALLVTMITCNDIVKK